jgi:glycosyltransferase involved in cell wall biosynthesis
VPPSISIVVPNYNGAATLEGSLRSILDQQYPNLELIVVDGGSTDKSQDIIRRYEKNLAWWVSEKDTGQSNAINKGFARCTGEIVNWLCSDDLLTPGALQTIGNEFSTRPELDVLVGACEIVSLVSGQRELWEPDPKRIALLPCCNPIPQSSCFYRRKLLSRTPPVAENHHYMMDFELWCYFKSQDAKFGVTDKVLSIFQTSRTNKTSAGRLSSIPEWEAIYRQYAHELVPLVFWHKHLRFPIERLRQRHRENRFIFNLTRGYTGAFSRFFGLFYGTERAKAMNWEWFLRPMT